MTDKAIGPPDNRLLIYSLAAAVVVAFGIGLFYGVWACSI
ncbi:hypothetical protein LCGC14_2742780 [marine sediment metagenome]|uniref:Uncharacterized protein n=1 Tax=marine sediment metagenome TaxID=412755 RepID=A0A0F9BCX1_9ZZZZ